LIEQKFLLKGAKFGHIEDVAVVTKYERRGIGKLLIEALSDEAERRGCCTVRLDCTEKNRTFYEKCGFYAKELMMQKDLHFIKV